MSDEEEILDEIIEIYDFSPLPSPSQSTVTELRCQECGDCFSTETDFFVHTEECVLAEFEREHITEYQESDYLNDIRPQNVQKAYPISEGPKGISVKVDVFNQDQNVEKITIRPRFASWGRFAKSSKQPDPKPIAPNSPIQPIQKISESDMNLPYTGIEDIQPIKGPGGLNMLVSVEHLSQEEADRLTRQPKPRGRNANPTASNDQRLKIKCPTCSLVLYRHNFPKHNLIHTGERNFICSIEECKKAFRTKSDLKSHAKVHSSFKKYICGEANCKYECRTQYRLSAHLDTHHIRGPVYKKKSQYRWNKYKEMATVEELEGMRDQALDPIEIASTSSQMSSPFPVYFSSPVEDYQNIEETVLELVRLTFVVAAMRRILCVAEKNDVAKGVSAILGRGQANRKEGRSKYNKIYQFQLNDSVIVMTSVSGHLLNYAFGPEMKNWSEVSIRTLFDAPIYHNVIPGMEDIQRTLKEEAPKADLLIIFTDCDREGEAIGAEIIKTCTSVNRRLDIYRAKFSEITPRAIHQAMNNLGRVDYRMVEAVDCRSELDLRIGAAFTRLQTLHLRNKFAQMFREQNHIVSYGSCQFPTLGFVVERYKAIQEFITETFWKIVVEHKRNNCNVEFMWERQRLFDRETVEVLLEDCVDARVAKIVKVNKKPKSKWRPQALDTVELEKLAVRKLKMSAKTAMTIAEKLYQKGFISYPRTETNKFPPDIQLSQLANVQTASHEWGQFAEQIVERNPNPRNGHKSDEAHPPIHPLKFATRNELDNNEWRVYELVVRHFLACISWDAKGQETRVDMKCGEENFHATGLIIEDMGYMNVYPYEKWSDKTLPPYHEGEIINDHKMKMADGATQPPLLLNEADLIALMDKYGIGTDATHAEHIEKIKERQYVEARSDGRFVPGFLGLGLVDGYDDMGFAMSKPHMRADLERQLQAICIGSRQKQPVLQEQLGKYRTIFVQAEAQVHKLSHALTNVINNDNNQNFPPDNHGGGDDDDGGAPPPPRQTRARGRGRNAQPQPNRIESDEVPPNTGRGRGRGRGRGSVSTKSLRGGRGGMDNAPAPAPAITQAPLAANGKQCQCGQAAAQRTVRKEGPNKGKQFYGCAKGMDDSSRCNFFEWVQ